MSTALRLRYYAPKCMHALSCKRYGSLVWKWCGLSCAVKSKMSHCRMLSNYLEKVSHPTMTGAMLIICKALRHAFSSSAESKTAGVFMNVKKYLPIRHALMSLNHPPPPTPMKTDDSITNGFVYNNAQQKRSKSWDILYHWLRDRWKHNKIKVYWEKGQSKNADYCTKNHSTKHHLLTRTAKPHVNDH